MKKILKIASYDFRRLMTNPITIGVTVVVFLFALIFSAAYPIPTAETYSAAVSGSTTKSMVTNFKDGAEDVDSKADLDAIVTKTNSIITILSQSDDEDTDKTEINDLVSNETTGFEKIISEIDKYRLSTSYSSSYLTSFAPVETAVSNLGTFLTRYSELSAFESRVVFEKVDFEFMQDTYEKLSEITASGSSNTEKLNALVEIKDDITELKNILQKRCHTFLVGSSILSDLKTYVATAQTKLYNINSALETLSDKASNESSVLSETAATITAYKLTCESLQTAVIDELYLYFNRSYGDADEYFLYTSTDEETLKLEIAKAEYYLEDESTSYTEAQVALNFNTASTQITAYDATYTTMAVVGFVCILFGIYCAYKLFGNDRKKGKLDIVLSQNVTSGQVFSGTVLSIVYCTSAILAVFTVALLLWNLIFHGTIAGSILTVFNLSSAYTIHPLLFLVIKIVGIELQVVFYTVLTVFIMNLSRKFELSLGIAILIFVLSTILNIFCNTSVVWCLFPFIHADLTSMVGGGLVDAGFLQTAIYASGNFFISLAYYLVVVVLLFTFTKQLFKKN